MVLPSRQHGAVVRCRGSTAVLQPAQRTRRGAMRDASVSLFSAPDLLTITRVSPEGISLTMPDSHPVAMLTQNARLINQAAWCV